MLRRLLLLQLISAPGAVHAPRTCAVYPVLRRHGDATYSTYVRSAPLALRGRDQLVRVLVRVSDKRVAYTS